MNMIGIIILCVLYLLMGAGVAGLVYVGLDESNLPPPGALNVIALLWPLVLVIIGVVFLAAVALLESEESYEH